MILLELQNVTKEYPLRTRRRSWLRPNTPVKAVNKVSLTVKRGESIGLVGESGSGKSTLAKLIMKIEPVTSGRILLNGEPIHSRRMNGLTLYKQIQFVMQDSAASLYPKMQVKEILEEPLRHYFPDKRNTREAECANLLEMVGLDASFLTSYPFQLSGGQKQRVCIAKALAVQPEIIIFDESIASLDQLSQQAIVNKLKIIQEERHVSYLFITHDLQSTKQLCNRVMVMFEGEIVDTFSHWDAGQLHHPYSQLLYQTLK